MLDQIEADVLRPQQLCLLWMIDGKPLTIGGCSKDRQAGYGRAAGTMAKGYELHAVFGPRFTVVAWRIASMNKDERVMARRLLRDAPVQGDVLADGNCDSNDLRLQRSARRMPGSRRCAIRRTTPRWPSSGDRSSPPKSQPIAFDGTAGRGVPLRPLAVRPTLPDRATLRPLGVVVSTVSHRGLALTAGFIVGFKPNSS